jgi:hypothetical protein
MLNPDETPGKLAAAQTDRVQFNYFFVLDRPDA